MAPLFSFNLNNDDIDESTSDCEEYTSMNDVRQDSAALAVEPKLHTLEDMLSALPSKISYSSIPIPGNDGAVISLPRRELFDIRAQLMAEDQTLSHSPTLGLSADDITPNVYEGGFKTWECSVDLASFLLNTFTNADGRIDREYHIIELGAGSALPTLVLFYLILKTSSPWWGAIHLSLADYNQSVLELATVPNLLLTWHFVSSFRAPPPVGDLEVTPDLVYCFLKDLSSRLIHVSGISGAWNHAFSQLVRPFDDLQRQRITETILLASETIYSPSSISPFSDVLLSALKSCEGVGGKAKALVAAKRIYFGVGGGVDDFLKQLKILDGEAKTVWETESAGVGRLILEVSKKHDSE